MEFTYTEYCNLLALIKKNEYRISDYIPAEISNKSRNIILRHDIDVSLEKAVVFAELEANWGASSTYFILLTSEFYNPFSRASKMLLDEIKSMGHSIGLHFDETCYFENGQWDEDEMIGCILREKELLESIIEDDVSTVSMHRPSKKTLDADLRISGMENSYGKKYFRDIKYVSDSYHRWREDIYNIIGCYDKIQLLTHPFWYNEMPRTRNESLYALIEDSRENTKCLIESNLLPLGVSFSESVEEDSIHED